jgi:hypothetical protein
VVGFAVLVGLLQVMLHAPVNWSPVYLVVAGAAIIAARRDLLRIGTICWSACTAPDAARLGLVELALTSILFGALLSATCYAVAPESGYDALANHMVLVRWVAWNGYWHFDPAIHDRALLPQGAGELFVWAYVLGGEAATKLLNAAGFWLTAGVVLAFASAAPQRLEAPRWVVLLGLLVLALTPLTVSLMQQLYEETVTTLFVTAAIVSLMLAWRNPRDASQGMMTFLLLGAACASKVQALFFGGIGLFAVINMFRGHDWRNALKFAVFGSLLFAVIGLVPYATDLAVTGKPFYPFEYGKPFDIAYVGKASADILYRMTFETGTYMESRNGAFGFQHLLLTPLVLVAGLLSRQGDRRVAACVLLLFIVAMLTEAQYVRYQFYAMAALLLLLPTTWAMLGRVGRTLLVAGLGFAAILNVAANRAAATPNFSLSQLLQPERFATGVPQETRIVEAINATYGADAVVYFAGPNFTAGLLGRDYTIYSPLRHAIEAARTPDEVEHLLREHGITHVVISTNPNMTKVVPTAALQQVLTERMVEVPLTLFEVRLFVFPVTHKR